MQQSPLLSRKEFVSACLARDQNRCVICHTSIGIHVHHIIERRLWDDGGYYVENGASLCGECHIKAEQTLISCDEIRAAAGILTVEIPEHFYPDTAYDKWGNIILTPDKRLKGELFFDESVQKILQPVLGLFLDYVKYPRTFHLPWSPGFTKDDKVLKDTKHFEGKEVIVTVKMDGENTSMYHDYIHARSLDSRNHPSRNWVKNLHGRIAADIPDGWRICGENLYAKHSIPYKLRDVGPSSYFMVFSVWTERNVCLSWEATEEWIALLGLQTVPVLYRGTWDESVIRGLARTEYDGNLCEGYVVRLTSSYSFDAFRKSIAKYVRKGHVATHNHWSERVIKNELRPT